jgi:hypothetical protein
VLWKFQVEQLGRALPLEGHRRANWVLQTGNTSAAIAIRFAASIAMSFVSISGSLFPDQTQS